MEVTLFRGKFFVDDQFKIRTIPLYKEKTWKQMLLHLLNIMYRLELCCHNMRDCQELEKSPITHFSLGTWPSMSPRTYISVI